MSQANVTINVEGPLTAEQVLAEVAEILLPFTSYKAEQATSITVFFAGSEVVFEGDSAAIARKKARRALRSKYGTSITAAKNYDDSDPQAPEQMLDFTFLEVEVEVEADEVAEVEEVEEEATS